MEHDPPRLRSVPPITSLMEVSVWDPTGFHLLHLLHPSGLVASENSANSRATQAKVEQKQAIDDGSCRGGRTVAVGIPAAVILDIVYFNHGCML